MTNYQGQYNHNGEVMDQPRRGGKYVETHGEAHESCNFLADKNGIVYGHVETWRGDNETGKDTEIKIENLGASRKDSYVHGIDVIWIATHPEGGKRVVGWYKNAMIYRARQIHDNEFATEQHERDSIHSYRIYSRAEDVFLINESQRNLILDPSNNRTGWPGRNSIFYPINHKDNRELLLFIEHLKEQMESNTTPLFSPIDDSEYNEGKTKLSFHKKKERSSKLVKAFKKQLTDYSCAVCGFSFEDFYGALGCEYIEAHHIVPVSTLTKDTKMTVSDLVGVCSNCHRMLHRSNDPISVKELENIVRLLGISKF